jgi:hypothetical protein
MENYTKSKQGYRGRVVVCMAVAFEVLNFIKITQRQNWSDFPSSSSAR